MILGYRPPLPGESEFWFGFVGKDNKKFRRVVAGLILPEGDRAHGALVVLAELFRSTGPQDFTGIGAKTGDWPELENALGQFRRDLKFDHVITEPGSQTREMLWKIPGLSWGLGEIPLVTYEAPRHAVFEVARQKTDQMIREGRLHLDLVEKELDESPDEAAKALQCAVIWMQDNKPVYPAKRTSRPIQRRVFGAMGR